MKRLLYLLLAMLASGCGLWKQDGTISDSPVLNKLISLEEELIRNDDMIGQRRTREEQRKQACVMMDYRWGMPDGWTQSRLETLIAETKANPNAEALTKSQVAYFNGQLAEAEKLSEIALREALKKVDINDAQSRAMLFVRFKQCAFVLYATKKHAAAATIYRQTLEKFTHDIEPERWAELQLLLGHAESNLAEFSEGEVARQHRAAAVSAYRLALQVYTRKHVPQDWAYVQNILGLALWQHADTCEGTEQARLLGEAVTAYRLALEVRTRKDFPQQWARTQNNLGNALSKQASASDGAEQKRLFGEAIAAYRLSLEVRTRNELPQDWAKVQNNMGIILYGQALVSMGAERMRLLRESIAAYRLAQEVWTRSDFPQRWGDTQNNLALALNLLAHATEEKSEILRLRKEAVACAEDALQLRSKEHFPMQHQQTQHLLTILRPLLAKSENEK